MVVEVDQYDELHARYGAHVMQLILRKLGKLITGRIRAEDTLSQHSPSQFALLSPGIDRVSSCAFALRVCASVEKLVMAYRDERIRVTLSIGVANALADQRSAVSDLLALAVKRAAQARAAGGNRVFADAGEVDPAEVERQLARMPSIDNVLRQLRAGGRDVVLHELAHHCACSVGVEADPSGRRWHGTEFRAAMDVLVSEALGEKSVLLALITLATAFLFVPVSIAHPMLMLLFHMVCFFGLLIKYAV